MQRDVRDSSNIVMAKGLKKPVNQNSGRKEKINKEGGKMVINVNMLF